MSEEMARQKWLGVEGIHRYLEAGNEEPFERLILAVKVFFELTEMWCDHTPLARLGVKSLCKDLGVSKDELMESLSLLARAGVVNLLHGDQGLTIETPNLQTWS
jgi:hypothetical protein